MLAFFDPMCAIKSDALSDPRAAHEKIFSTRSIR
jgi:hypothetical protein